MGISLTDWEISLSIEEISLTDWEVGESLICTPTNINNTCYFL